MFNCEKAPSILPDIARLAEQLSQAYCHAKRNIYLKEFKPKVISFRISECLKVYGNLLPYTCD